MNENDALALVTVPIGPLVIVVSGGVLSTTSVRAALTAVADVASVARAVTVTSPSPTVVVSQSTLYGSVRSVPTTTPLTRKSTPAIPSGSDACAVSCTTDRTWAPSAGAVSATVGAVAATLAESVHSSTRFPVAPRTPSRPM